MAEEEESPAAESAVKEFKSHQSEIRGKDKGVSENLTSNYVMCLHLNVITSVHLIALPNNIWPTSIVLMYSFFTTNSTIDSILSGNHR